MPLLDKSKLADNEDELVLLDQSIIPVGPSSPILTPTVVVTEAINNDDEEEESTNMVEEAVEEDKHDQGQTCMLVLEDEDHPVKDEEEPPIKDLPPPPPKRSSQTNQRLKKLSKMIKYTIPSRMSKVGSSNIESSGGGKKGKLERKSLKEKVLDGELAAFLKERRAVSESRFRIVDKTRSPSPVNIVRTRSDPDLSNHDDQDFGPTAMGISPGNLNNLVEKFERQSSPSPPPGQPSRSGLKSPTMIKEALANNPRFKSKSPSPIRNTIVQHHHSSGEELENNKKNQQHHHDNSTTSPESGMDDASKSESEGKNRKNGKNGKKDKNKERKRHSGCEACNSDREHREHKKDKKRAKKERSKTKEGKRVTIVSDTEGKSSKKRTRPPYPNSEDLGNQKDGFFKQLLINETTNKHQTSIQRSSRPPIKKPTAPSNRPAFNTFLREKKSVSESKFRKGSASPIERGNARYLPPGVLQGEMFFENRSKFENGLEPVATFPRSLSNLEKRSSSQLGDILADRPQSALSNGGSRASSLPRPGSGYGTLLDHEEYKKYVLQLMHSTQKSPRFTQLQAYYNILDRALKLEKKSSSMEIHRLKSDAVIDFETWRKLRIKEKARDELDVLMSSLKEAQRARQFHFRPKEVASVSWRGDIRLRGRDKSVENLKNHFTKIVERKGTTEESCTKIAELNETKDMYKPLWRATSVGSTATSIKRSNHPRPQASSVGKLGDTKYTTIPQSRTRSRSSLTQQQVTTVRGQLTDIFGSELSVREQSNISSRSNSRQDQYEISVPANKMDEVKKQLESQHLFVKPLPEVVQMSRNARTTGKEQPKSRESSTEGKQRLEEQKNLSFRIGQEIKQRSTEQQHASSRRTNSPRVCYSLETNGNAANFKQHDENNDFLLVLTSPNQPETRQKQVKTTVESWASCDHDEGAPGNESGKLRRKHLQKSNESISSSSSNNTVINNQRPKTDQDLERPKSVNELAKSYEEGINEIGIRPMSPTKVWNTNGSTSVKDMKRSFETFPMDLPKAPVRTSSFHRAIQHGGNNKPLVKKNGSLGKLSKSTSSIENILDDEPDFGQPKTSISHLMNDMSMSHPDLSDNESGPRSLRECFKRLGTQLSASRIETTNYSNNYLDTTSPLLHHFSAFGQPVHQPTQQQPNQSKYSRAYLNLVRTGEVNNKLSKFEPEHKAPRGYSQRTTANVYKRSELNKEYVAKHATDLTKVVIKTKEVGNIEHTMKRLEARKAGSSQQQQQSSLLSWQDVGQQSKAKLKHFCKKVSHSKILGKMVALQCATNGQMDKGTHRLIQKANQEETHNTVYQGGKVESTVDLFEKPVDRPISPGPAWTMANRSDSAFSWSKRFDANLPAPTETYSTAQKHNQFRKYYGYHPGDDQQQQQPQSLEARLGPVKPARGAAIIQDQPASLPPYLEHLPPPPPVRGLPTTSTTELLTHTMKEGANIYFCSMGQLLIQGSQPLALIRSFYNIFAVFSRTQN
jgi:hypothetical protein